MIITSLAVIFRIFSNSMANVYQKQLTSEGVSPFLINFIMYLGLSIFCLPFVLGVDFASFSISLWVNAILGGICGALGNSYLVRALRQGDLSVLGPINAYKSVVAMVFGIVMLKEIPSILGVLAVFLIVFGSYFVFDTQEEGFSFKLLRRDDIRYRIYALVFTAIEAVFIKNVILQSNVLISFFLWSLFGMIFTSLIVGIRRERLYHKSYFIFSRLLLVIILMGLMQYCTNFVFARLNVGYSLALFQLSTILSVILGWKFFKETQIRKKLIGSVIMVLGGTILILFN